KLLLENPAIAKSMAYHDGVNFARRITCDTYVCTGFADESCYPSNVFSMFNAIPATTHKYMSTNPFTGHFGTTRNTEGDKRLSEGFNTVTVLQDPL
ncbi:MAG: acetylxylan esterase, partial [Victivallales bacterium]|nr:acetylxylan esterase [Victivallales bacterium]